MGKFSKIKKYNLKSLSIDEKIKFLDKEMEKTGLNEKMTTQGMYSIVQPNPGTPQETANVPNSSNIGGSGFNQSSAGSGTEGDAPTFSSTSDLYNSSANATIFPSTNYEGKQGFGIVIGPSFGAGTTYGIIEGGNTYRAVLGGHLAGGTRGSNHYYQIYKAKADNPATYGQDAIDSAKEQWQLAVQVEAALIEIGYDNTLFNVTWKAYRSPILFENLSGFPSYSHPTKGLLYLVPFSILGTANKYVTQPEIPPHNVVVREDDLGDPSFLPINIDGMSPEAFKALLDRSDKKLASTDPNIAFFGNKGKGKINKKLFKGPTANTLNLLGNQIVNGQDFNGSLQKQFDKITGGSISPEKFMELYPILTNPSIKETEFNKILDDANKSSVDDNLDTFASAGYEPEIVTVPNNEAGEGPKPSKASGKGAKVGKWMSRTDFMALYPNSSMVEYLDALPYGPSDFMTPNPNFPGAWDLNTKGYENFFMNGDLSALGNREGTPKPRNANTTEVEYTPQELKKGFTVNQTLNYLKTKFKSPLGPATDIMADIVANTFGQKASKAVLDDYMRNFIPDLFRGKNPAGATSGNPRNVGKMYSDKAINDYEEVYKDYQREKRGEKDFSKFDLPWTNKYNLIQSDNSEIGNTTGTLDPENAGDGFVDNGDGTETLLKRYDFDRMDDMAGSSLGSTLGAYTYGIISGIPGLLGKGEGGRTPSAYIGVTFDKKTGKVIKNYKKGIVESLDESVKLGHFEPEALTVDIEDLRKGIVPEFPKKAPPKMIDGYSEKSKLAPKKAEKTPFIKITKKDLAKNHLLKDSEIKEFMDQINAVNEYIKKHPEELIHVQQRYPKDDKRLAALNWKMDQMLESGKEYLDTQFPENQRLVDRIKKATKKTMELTNPEAYKGLKKPDMELMSLDDHMKEKRVVSRHFKKKRQSNSMFRVDMKKVKEKNRKVAEQKVAEWQEKRRIELLNSNEFDELKSDWKKDLQAEGMTTQMLTGILPSTGDADLETLQTGLSGDGLIDYGEAGLGDEVMVSADSQYTCFSNLDAIQNANDPSNVGTSIRLFDQNTKQFRSGSTGGGGHGYLQAIPGYVQGMMRNAKPSGDYNRNENDRRERLSLPVLQGGSNLYYHLYGPTNDVLGLGYGTWNSNDGVTAARTGTRLDFNGSGSPRYAALKAIDSTGFDTIKIHALLGDNDIVNTYTDPGSGTVFDKRVQVYYWAGDHKDYVSHPSASSSLISGQPRDGWRPINLKPNGEVDPDVDPYIIKHTADRIGTAIDANGVSYSTDNKLAPYSIPLPDYTRSKNAKYMIIQVDVTSGDAFSVLSVRFQRRSNVKTPALTKPLTDIETSPFVRVGAGKESLGAKERKKKVKDIIDGGLNYTERKFSKDFPVRTTLESKLFEKLKDRKIIKEGMTTQVLTGILPSAGNTDLDMLQLGATGSDLSYTSGDDSPVDGEFTALVNTDPITSVTDPLDVGTNIRSPQNGASLSLDFTDSDVFHTHVDPGDSVPGDDGGTRGAGISGNYNSGYVNDEGTTNENVPLDNFNGESLPTRVGTHLAFGNHTRLSNAGFPRYAALKAVDTTEMDTLSMNWFARGTVNTDTVDGSPTQGEKVVGGTVTKMNTVGDGVSVFYWAGDKESAATYAPSVSGSSKINDGWRPINVKPDGTTDNTYSPWLITHKADVATYGTGTHQKHDSGYPAEVLLNNKITLPPWCRDKNTRFLLHQGRNAAGAASANFGITSVRFQRRSTMKVRSLMKPLSDVESSPFVRVGPTKKNEGGKERKKKVQDIIRSGLKYTGKKFSKDFPVRTDLE